MINLCWGIARGRLEIPADALHASDLHVPYPAPTARRHTKHDPWHNKNKQLSPRTRFRPDSADFGQPAAGRVVTDYEGDYFRATVWLSASHSFRLGRLATRNKVRPTICDGE